MQIFIKLVPSTFSTSHVYDFETIEARQDFIDNHSGEIYWYYFPEDGHWCRGPAWNPPEAAKVDETDDGEDDGRW